MKKTILVVLAVTVASLGFNTSSWAKKRKKLYPYESVAGSFGTGTSLDLAVADDGTAIIHSLGGNYNLGFMGTGIGWGYIVTGEGDLCPGNLILSVGRSFSTKSLKGPNAYINGTLALGLGLFDLDSPGAFRGAQLGLVSNQSWVGYLPESLVVQPKISVGTHLGSFRISGSVGTAFAVPVFDTDVRDTEIALRYSFGMGTGFGDRRGGFGFSVGGFGLTHLTGEEQNNVSISASIGLRLRIKETEFGRHMIRPSIGGSIPLTGEKAGIDGVVSIGFSYYVDAFKYVPDEPAK